MLKLKEERIKNGYTQKEIASKIGICERQYIRIEKGYLPPTYHVILKLEDLFGMSHRELFKEVE